MTDTIFNLFIYFIAKITKKLIFFVNFVLKG